MIISKRLVLGVLLGAMFALAATTFADEGAIIVFGGWLLGVLLGTMLVLTVMVFAE